MHCALANTVLVRHVCNYYLVGAIFQPNQFSLQSVLQQASSIMSSGDDHLLTTIQEHYTMAGQLISLTKKQGVSGKDKDLPLKVFLSLDSFDKQKRFQKRAWIRSHHLQ